MVRLAAPGFARQSSAAMAPENTVRSTSPSTELASVRAHSTGGGAGRPGPEAGPRSTAGRMGGTAGAGMAMLEVRDLAMRFRTDAGDVHAVDGISFEIAEGEFLGLVGESGSGKSATMLSMMRLLPMPPAEILSGTAVFEGRDLLQLDAAALRRVRGGKIGFIFQDPMTSLNPVLTVGYQLGEALRTHLGIRRQEARDRTTELLRRVGIPNPESRLSDFPHRFSGGMRQRVMIAIALACNPRLLIADEPTTALDVTVQAQVLALVKELRQQIRMSIVWITHDLGVMAGLADRIMVMYAGRIVERAPAESLYRTPRHPYTRALLGALPRLDGAREKRLPSIEGHPPNLLGRTRGCAFAPRCPHVFARCREAAPALEPVGTGHEVACWWDGHRQAQRAPRTAE